MNLDLCDIVFSIDEIEAAMNKTPDNMSSGPDGLPGILFHRCSQSLAKPVHILWTESLNQMKVPVKMKKSIVIPGLKPGASRYDPSSYRPLSMTNHLKGS